MTTPCTSCGAPVAPGELRCPECDALAPVPDVADVDGDQTRADVPPWSIPIREPEATGPRAERRHPVGAGRRPDLGRMAGLVLLAVAVLALTVVIGAELLTDDGGGEPRAADVGTSDESAGLDARSVRAEGESAADEATTSTTASTTTTSTTATTTSTTQAPPPPTTTTRPAVPAGTGSVPALSSSFRGGWVAQLTSVPYSAGTARLEAAWEVARGYAADAVAARSDDWTSLRDGYWVLVDPGPFSSADEVRAFCSAAGHADRDDCLPRELDGRG